MNRHIMRQWTMGGMAATAAAAGVAGLVFAAPDARPVGAPDAKPGPEIREVDPAVRARLEAVEKQKVVRFLEHLRATDADLAKEAAAQWDRIKDAPFDAENDFILDTLAGKHAGLADALDLLDGGATAAAGNKLKSLAAGPFGSDPYLAAHIRRLQARIKYAEGDWQGAADLLADLLAKDAGRMTLEHEVFYDHARVLADISAGRDREAVGKRFAEFLDKYPFSKRRYLAAAADLAREVAKTLPLIRSEGLTDVNGGPEQLPKFAKDLRNIEKRLSLPLRDTGPVTQRLQGEALAYLDNLIEKAEQQQNKKRKQQKQKDQQDPKDKKDSKDPKDGKDQKPGDPKDQMPDMGSDPKEQPGDPRKDSRLSKGNPKGGPALKDLDALRKGNFGTLPPEDVNKILLEALRSGDIPDKYRRALELYSDELGKQVNRTPKK